MRSGSPLGGGTQTTMENYFAKEKIGQDVQDVITTFLEASLPNHICLAYQQHLGQHGLLDGAATFLGYLQTTLGAEMQNEELGKILAPETKIGCTMIMEGLEVGPEVAGLSTVLALEMKPDQVNSGVALVAKSKAMCGFCNIKAMHRCYQFACVSLESKYQYLKKTESCFKCLKQGHNMETCEQILYCNFCDLPVEAKHHQMLHHESSSAVKGQAMMMHGEKDLPIVKGFVGQHTSLQEVTTATFVLHIKCPKTNKIIWVNALADIGATDFLMDTSLGDRLGIVSQPCLYDVVAHHGQEMRHKAITGSIVCLDPKMGEEYDFQFYAYDGPSEGLYPEDWSKLKTNFEHLANVDVPAPVQGNPLKQLLDADMQAFFTAM